MEVWSVCCDGNTDVDCDVEVIDVAADVPFVERIDCGRAVVTPATGSALFIGHGPVRCGFLRAAVLHPPLSPLTVMGPPFI